VRLRPASLYAIERDVVLIPLTLVGLERELNLLGLAWRRKHEFHVTALSAERLVNLTGRNIDAVWQAVEAAVLRQEIGGVSLRVRELRLVNEDDERTLVVMCDVEGLAELYETLSERLGTDIPPPPAHVTLYTRPGGEGIGLHDDTDLHELTRPLTDAEVDEFWEATGLAG
jgi:hypothetical protein